MPGTPSTQLVGVLLAAALTGGCAVFARDGGGWIACRFVPVEEDRDVIAHCAHRGTDGKLRVEPVALDLLAARGGDLAAVVFGDELHYLNAAGVAVPVLPFDNGADYCVEGFARTLQGGKVGFIDENLRVVIPPRWDFAFPFENGTAAVCNGCTFRPLGDGHHEVVGGRWGAIDARGEVVIPVIHDRDVLRAMLDEPDEPR